MSCRGYLRPRGAEISYATVQGVDCAIEKFRNSSVMDEYPGDRSVRLPECVRWNIHRGCGNFSPVG